jgi:L-xylulokinase
MPRAHSRLLGIDAGSSAIKAVLFDERGTLLGEESVAVPLIRKKGGVVERDLAKVWRAVVELLGRMKDARAEDFQGIDAVGLTGAGDGLILLDDTNTPVRPAISSLDTRASDLAARFKHSDKAKDLYSLIGENPFPATPLALLKWMKLNERARYDAARKIIFLKDWIRFKLTSEVCTDITDASATLTDFNGAYRKEIFGAFGVGESFDKTVEVRMSHDLAGRVTRRASSLTGLKAGTPVVCGLHDCSASSLGTGCIRPGETCLILGSWAGNQIVTGRPILNRKHPDQQILRNYAIPGKWLIISASPTSLVNLDWFIGTFMSGAEATDSGAQSPYARVDELVRAVGSDEAPLYHPYLYGSQRSEDASAGFYGVRPAHTLAHFLKSIYEGIAINYSIHEDKLEECLRIETVNACGGGTRSRILTQIVADALNREVRLFASHQTTALGAAITAAVGVGVHQGYEAACKAMTSVRGRVSPRKKWASRMKEKKATFMTLYGQMVPLWRDLHL